MPTRFVLFVIAVIVAGCGTAGSESSAAGDRTAVAEPPTPAPGVEESDIATPPTAAQSPSDAAPQATAEAPFGTVDAVGGGQIEGAELAGRDLALWFWAPW